MAPSSTTSHNQTDPLLPSKLINEQPEHLPSTSSTSIKALSILRIAVGASCLIAPRFSCALFQFPIPAAMSVMPRLFGVRDLVLGELLLTAEDKNGPDRGRREIKRALWAGIGTDAVDIASILVGVVTGTVGRIPAAIFGGGAVAFIGLGALGMRGL
ncbi:hypothetical protein K469DRAFT_712153 [Zopfia rhizophila CBS 207.26]|uniref:Uncharacterized protein n=1 Tax=Zopfia rhizophila CBS 207.26 TaxID=1314779 RepID=A0A6A6EMI8_9PEZI|nr:hypothetical protein K469DRAFT_712153 [Zopfia rhizophila CBS 207.26]